MRGSRAAVGVGLLAVVLGSGVFAVGAAVDRLVPQESCEAGGHRISIAEAERFSALVATATRQKRPLTEAVTAIGGEHAQLLAEALSGRAPAAFSCRVRPGSHDQETPGPTGLTPRARSALEAVENAWGTQKAGGFDPKGIDSGHMEGSAHYSGRAVDLFYGSNRQGWATAQYLVANARRLQLATVIYDGRIWTARRSGQGWRDYVPPNGNTRNATLMHRDHVHLDVP